MYEEKIEYLSDNCRKSIIFALEFNRVFKNTLQK